MNTRWHVLAVLFLTRSTMGFQFQSVAALSPYYLDTFSIGLTELGLLIGLYLSPGIVLAAPGGAIGQRFGDMRVVGLGLGLMILGGVLIAAVPVWEAQIAGRLMSGAGGVLLNVLLAKMVSDWFADRGLALAMGIYVNSWPVGIALALLVMPVLAGAQGLTFTLWVVPTLVCLGLILFLTGYRSPETHAATSTKRVPLSRHAFVGMIVTGGVWGFFNAALVVVFGFGPILLAERGWSEAQAGSGTSLVLWLIAFASPLGGWISDRVGRQAPVLYIGLIAFAITLILAPSSDAPLLWFVLIGLSSGLVPGAIMSLPIAYLSTEMRALGMGIYFAVYYVAIFLSPIVAGAIADALGATEAAFWAGAAMVGCALLCLVVNEKLQTHR